MDKARAVAALAAQVHQALTSLESVAAMARDEIASDETKQEGKYDTRSTEASYLARGQAMRIAGLRRLRAWFEMRTKSSQGPATTVALGALVLLEGEGGDARWLFVAPEGGFGVELDGRRVQMISPSSPLYLAMAGLGPEDAFEAESPRGTVAWEILEIQ